MMQSNTPKPPILQYSQLECSSLLRKLGVSSQGLSCDQVKQQRKRFGENVLQRKKHVLPSLLFRAFFTPFSIVLLVLTVISFVTDVLLVSNFSRSFTAPVIMFSMLLAGGGLRLTQELQAKRISEQLAGLARSRISVRRDGQWQEVCAEELVVGDLVRLHPGDRVPADIRLLSASALFVSQSAITGESGVTEKSAEPLLSPPAQPAACRNAVLFGSVIVGGSGEGIVLAVGRDMVFGGLSRDGAVRKDSFDRGANSVARVLIRYMALFIPIVFLASGLAKGNWLSALLFSLSAAVGLTPELLPMVVSACLAKGSRSMQSEQTVVKNVNAMQTFASMDMLCVDKTGTLTGDVLQLEYYTDILGNESETVLQYAFLNSFFHTDMQNALDRAVLRCLERPEDGETFRELTKVWRKLDGKPFDPDRRMASVLLSHENESLLLVKGSVESVCARCCRAEYRGQRYEFGSDALASVRTVTEEMAEDGMKVLAVAYKRCPNAVSCDNNENDLTLIGYLAFFDSPRPDAGQAVERLRELHVGVKLLTGDQRGPAVSVCRRIGIPTEHVLTGPELDTLSANELPVCVEKTTVFAELSPRQKAQVTKLLQENGHTVGFLGDGLNDLPAILQADVGVSADSACESLRDCADVILFKKDLNILSRGITEGRRAFANMTKYIRITASSNLGNICAIVAAGVLLPFLPMTSIQLLLLNLLYDILCLILPWDNVDEEQLRRPLEWSGRTLSRFMRVFGPVSSLFDLLTFAILFFVLCPALCGGSFFTLGDEQKTLFISLFQTGWFLESMWTQVLILQLLRTRRLAFFRTPAARPVLAVTALGILAFTLLPLLPAGRLLGLTVMPPIYYLFLVGIVILYLLLVTLVKALYLRRWHDLS